MIELNHVTLDYGDKRVLDDLTLSLPTDRITCLYGPSGCGKTTLLRLIAGLIAPQSGTVTGAPKNPAFLFQENRLIPHLTAQENIAAVLPPDRAEEAGHWLAQVDLASETSARPAALSGGMRRRVALARALAYGGDFLLLDEPFTGMDEQLIERMATLIKSTTLPALVATHSPEEIHLLGGVTLAVQGIPFKPAY